MCATSYTNKSDFEKLCACMYCKRCCTIDAVGIEQQPLLILGYTVTYTALGCNAIHTFCKKKKQTSEKVQPF